MRVINPNMHLIRFVFKGVLCPHLSAANNRPKKGALVINMNKHTYLQTSSFSFVFPFHTGYHVSTLWRVMQPTFSTFLGSSGAIGYLCCILYEIIVFTTTSSLLAVYFDISQLISIESLFLLDCFFFVPISPAVDTAATHEQARKGFLFFILV